MLPSAVENILKACEHMPQESVFGMDLNFTVRDAWGSQEPKRFTEHIIVHKSHLQLMAEEFHKTITMTDVTERDVNNVMIRFRDPETKLHLGLRPSGKEGVYTQIPFKLAEGKLRARERIPPPPLSAKRVITPWQPRQDALERTMSALKARKTFQGWIIPNFPPRTVGVMKPRNL